jgi:hypothetical protein
MIFFNLVPKVEALDKKAWRMHFVSEQKTKEAFPCFTVPSSGRLI